MFVSNMQTVRGTVLLTWVVLLAFGSACAADTFTHRHSGEVIHGYATRQIEDGNNIVHTQEKGVLVLNLAEWDTVADRLGRNNEVIVLTLDKEIMLDIETHAAEQAIATACDEGPLCILLEIDTPGGRTDLAQRLCSAVARAGNCEVIAFVKGGKYGGALSAGAAVAFACDRIYMANNTVIGAATVVAVSESGLKDLKEVYGEDVGEKVSSAWRAYLASLAQRQGRPGLLARAMVDKEIEVVEVSWADRRFFIDPVNKRPDQKLVRTWSKKGSLLTLTAAEAAECMIADKIVNSRQEVLRDLGVAGAEVAIDDSIQKAGKEFRRVRLRVDKLRKSLDLEIKQLQQTRARPKALKLLREVRADFKSLIALAKRYPDLGLSVESLQAELNSVEAFYQQVKIDSRRR